MRVTGYDTTQAATGAEALAAARTKPFNVALIDLQLPDTTGLEVMIGLRKILPLVESIILTGHASMDSAIDAIKHGAFSYLSKPYEMGELIHKIKQAIGLQEAQADIVRLASFPRLDPSPVIEIDHHGAVTYLNPAAESLFPDLYDAGLEHELMRSLADQIAKLRESRQLEATCYEASVSGRAYELHASYVHEVDLTRIYVTDITERKRTEGIIQRLATTDSLTGIVNRHEFSRILSIEMARTDRYGVPMSLVMYDIDNFKGVNDSFGHAVGDDVLRSVTDLIKADIRLTDVLARWGGEEFMVLMPHSNLEGASSAAEKLRLTLARESFDRVGSVTASFGVSEFVPQEDANALIKRVDDALYRAKESGRNRVETSAPSALAKEISRSLS